MEVLKIETLDVLKELPDLSVKILRPLPLSILDPRRGKTVDQDLKKLLKQNGVYFLLEQREPDIEFSPVSKNVIYIGKAGGKGEKIFHRCRKHFCSLVDFRTSKGDSRERPGKGLIRVRERRGKSVEGIYFYPGLIFSGERQVTVEHHPYLISLVEEFLLHLYCKSNDGRLPEGNVKS
jgi:hypothetical protein